MTLNGHRTPNATGIPVPPETAPVFDAEAIEMQRRTRFNPLRALDPQSLSIALDQFDSGTLHTAALLWDAMARRDDTLVTVKPQLEQSIAAKDWGVFKIEGAPEPEASRHAAALNYFYEHCRAVNAFDRNERGSRDKLIAQMMMADSYQYAVHHLVWRPSPGRAIPVEGAQPVPALTATFEYVPLWFFENTTGTLRFLRQGGFGAIGESIDFEEGEWMVTVGRGLMFAASICYTFKRLTFQDWTIFNERFAQAKPVGQTGASRESAQGRAMADIIANFNGDQGIVLYDTQPGAELPISLLGPGSAQGCAELFERFIDRQDRKMASMYRGNDLSMMSRAQKGGEIQGASLQEDEGDAMEKGACRMIAASCHENIDRHVIRYCFGEDVEPLAYFGLPDTAMEDARQLRESAGFLADRGAAVHLRDVADRLGVQLAAEGEEVLSAGRTGPVMTTANGTERANRTNALLKNALQSVGRGVARDLDPLRGRIAALLEMPDAEFPAGLAALRADLPEIARRAIKDPAAAGAFEKALGAALLTGLTE